MVRISKSNGNGGLDGYRPASKEVIQIDSNRKEFRDSGNESRYGWKNRSQVPQTGHVAKWTQGGSPLKIL